MYKSSMPDELYYPWFSPVCGHVMLQVLEEPLLVCCAAVQGLSIFLSYAVNVYTSGESAVMNGGDV